MYQKGLAVAHAIGPLAMQYIHLRVHYVAYAPYGSLSLYAQYKIAVVLPPAYLWTEDTLSVNVRSLPLTAHSLHRQDTQKKSFDHSFPR